MYRFMDESRATLLKLQPAWQNWYHTELPALNKQALDAHASNEQEQNNQAAYLSAIEQTTLTITVNNSSTAALIKHQQSQLISALNAADVCDITKINVRIELVNPPMSAAITKRHSRSNSLKNTLASSHAAIKPPSQAAIDAVDHLKTNIKNPELANSLQNLANTLRTLAKKAD